MTVLNSREMRKHIADQEFKLPTIFRSSAITQTTLPSFSAAIRVRRDSAATADGSAKTVLAIDKYTSEPVFLISFPGTQIVFTLVFGSRGQGTNVRNAEFTSSIPAPLIFSNCTAKTIEDN